MIKITDKCKHCNRTCSNHVKNIESHQGNVCSVCKGLHDDNNRVPINLYVNGFFHRTVYIHKDRCFVQEIIYQDGPPTVGTFSIMESWENDTSEIRRIGMLNDRNVIKDIETGILKTYKSSIPSYIQNMIMDEPIESRYEILDL